VAVYRVDWRNLNLKRRVTIKISLDILRYPPTLLPMTSKKARFVPMTGQRIKELREKKGISQRELAKVAGIASCHIQHLESGRIRNPQFSTLCKIADALGCSRAKFFSAEA
jgi:DNA-binding XRE family transcriptional regulator